MNLYAINCGKRTWGIEILERSQKLGQLLKKNTISQKMIQKMSYFGAVGFVKLFGFSVFRSGLKMIRAAATFQIYPPFKPRHTLFQLFFIYMYRYFYPLTTAMAHFWTTYFLTVWEIEWAVIFQNYEKSRSEIESRLINLFSKN